MVFRRHVEIARLWRMMGSLFGDIITFRTVGKFPIARICLSQDWVERFLDPSTKVSVLIVRQSGLDPYGGLMCHPLK